MIKKGYTSNVGCLVLGWVGVLIFYSAHGILKCNKSQKPKIKTQNARKPITRRLFSFLLEIECASLRKGEANAREAFLVLLDTDLDFQSQFVNKSIFASNLDIYVMIEHHSRMHSLSHYFYFQCISYIVLTSK